MSMQATSAGVLPPMPLCGLMCYGNAECQRCLFVYATGGFDTTCEFPAEVPLSVGIAKEVPYVDIAYVDGTEALRIEPFLKGDMILSPDRLRCMAGESCPPCPWQPAAREWRYSSLWCLICPTPV